MKSYESKLSASEWIVIRLLLLIVFSVPVTNYVFDYVKNDTKLDLSYMDIYGTEENTGFEEGKAEINPSSLEIEKSTKLKGLADLFPLLKIIIENLKYNIYAQNNVTLNIPSRNIEDVSTVLRTDVNKKDYPSGNNYIPDIEVGDTKMIFNKDIYPEELDDTSIEFSFVLSDKLELSDSDVIISCRDKSHFAFFIKPTWYSWLIVLFVVASGIYAFFFALSKPFKFIMLGSPFYEIFREFKDKKEM